MCHLFMLQNTSSIASLSSGLNTRLTMRITRIVPALVVFMCASPTFAQQKVFEWQRGTEESVRLDPANYHGGESCGPQGGTIHVDIDAQQPVTIFMTGEGEWNRAMQNPEMLGSIQTVCLREHEVKVTYTCDLPLNEPPGACNLRVIPGSAGLQGRVDRCTDKHLVGELPFECGKLGMLVLPHLTAVGGRQHNSSPDEHSPNFRVNSASLAYALASFVDRDFHEVAIRIARRGS